MPSWKKLIVSGSDANLNSLSVTQNVTAAGFSGSFSGSFQGDGSGLTGIFFDIGDKTTYAETFSNQADITVTHLLNTAYPIVQVYDTSDEQVIPQRIKIINSSSVEVNFSSARSGYVVVAKGGHIIQGTAANSDLLNGEAGSYYLDYNNFSNIPPAGDSFPYTGSAIISGSLEVIGNVIAQSFTGSLLGTASNAVTASYALNGGGGGDSFPYTGSAIISGSLTITGSLYGNVFPLSITSNTASMDFGSANFFTLTLVSGSTTHINATNVGSGQSVNLLVTQASSGTGSVTFDSTFKFSSTYFANTITGSQDLLTFVTFTDTTKVYTSWVNTLD